MMKASESGKKCKGHYTLDINNASDYDDEGQQNPFQDQLDELTLDKFENLDLSDDDLDCKPAAKPSKQANDNDDSDL